MNRQEATRLNRQESTLLSLGFTTAEATSLRRISMTLRRWYEYECGTGDGQVSRSIDRDPETDKPFLRVQYPFTSITGQSGWVDRRYPTPDREKGAIKRLETILKRRNNIMNGHPTPAPDVELSYYLQTDPRGAALYILRPGDVPAGADPSSYYSRGICVY